MDMAGVTESTLDVVRGEVTLDMTEEGRPWTLKGVRRLCTWLGDATLMQGGAEQTLDVAGDAS